MAAEESCWRKAAGEGFSLKGRSLKFFLLGLPGEHEMQPFRLFVLVGRLNLKETMWNANVAGHPFLHFIVFDALHIVLNVSSAASRSTE